MSARDRILQAAVPRVKEFRDRVDDPDVRNGRRLVRSLRTAPPDVVVFGDSNWVFVAPYDDDQRRLAELVEVRLPAGRSMAACVGAGYHALLMRAFVHLIHEHGARPVVVVPLTARMARSAWRHHPRYSYERASELLHGFDRGTPLRQIRAPGRKVTEEEFERYAARQIDTWAGSMTIGDLRSRIVHPGDHGLDSVGARRMLYAYHHGEEVSPSDISLAEIEALGRALRELGSTVVAYETGIPVQEGVALWGEQFRERAEVTFALLRDSLRRGFGQELPIIESGMIFEPSEFIDSNDGSEHFNERGRHRYAEILTTAIKEALGLRSSS